MQFLSREPGATCNEPQLPFLILCPANQSLGKNISVQLCQFVEVVPIEARSTSPGQGRHTLEDRSDVLVWDDREVNGSFQKLVNNRVGVDTGSHLIKVQYK